MLRQKPQGLKSLVDSERFNAAVCGVIVANAVTLGLGTFPQFAHSPVIAALNTAFYAAFCIELLLRIAGYGKHFLRHGWNVFDLVVVLAGVIPGLGAGAQALRLVRLARIARLVRFLPDVKLLVSSVVRAIPPLGSLFAMTALLIFLYGMVAVELFGTAMPEEFGTIGAAALTLFVMLSLENFPDTLYTGMEVSAWAVPFFVSYALLAAFIIFNLLIGIIVGSLEDARNREVADSGDLQQTIAALRASLDALEQQI